MQIDKDMKYIINDWRKDIKSYMHDKTKKDYYRQLEWDYDRAHRIQKSAFSNHLPPARGAPVTHENPMTKVKMIFRASPNQKPVVITALLSMSIK